MTDTATPTAPTTEGGRVRRTWTPAQRRAAAARRAASGRSAATGDLIADEVVKDAVANLTALAGYLMPFAPHVGVTLAGVRHPDDPSQWLVRSRAEMAGHVLLEHAQQNARVLAAIARFNALFTSVEVVEVVASVGAAVAVDAKLIDPHMAVLLPGGIEAPIMAPVIGDVIAYVDSQIGPPLSADLQQASADELAERMQAGERAAALEFRRRQIEADRTRTRGGAGREAAEVVNIPGGVEET